LEEEANKQGDRKRSNAKIEKKRKSDPQQHHHPIAHQHHRQLIYPSSSS